MKWDALVVRAWVAGVLAGVYQPLPKEEIWEWAERTLRIPQTENEEMAGKLWSSSHTPYVRILLKWAKRPGKGEFWIKKSSQVGFTMAILIWICWMIVHKPGPVAYAIDSLTEAKNISKVRLQRWLTDNRILEGIGEDPEDLNNLTYYLRGMTLYMLGANSPGGFSNKPVEVFFLDEYDLHEYMEGHGTTASMARDRLKRPKNAKLVGLSKPGKTGQIGVEFKRGTMEEVRFAWPCCGHVQALRWSHFKFGTAEFRVGGDAKGEYDKAKVREGAYFECEKCQGRLLDGQKMKAMQECDGYPMNPNPEPAIRSLHIWDAYSPFVSFGELAVEWIEALKSPAAMERYMASRRGEYYEKVGGAAKHKDILACVAKGEMKYQRGTLPFVPLLLTAAIDVQGGVCKAVKVAFDRNGNAWVVDWTMTLTLQDAVDWCREGVLCRTEAGTEEMHYVWRAMIDEGHLAKEVRTMCLANMPIFWPVKGRGGVQVKEIVSTSVAWVGGEEILVYHVAEDHFKWDLLKMITEHEKRAKLGHPVAFFPEDVKDDEKFMDEMCAEVPVKIVINKQLGRVRWEWKKVGAANDWWDGVKYCLSEKWIMWPTLVAQGKAA